MAIGTQGEACDLICAKSASSARSAGNILSEMYSPATLAELADLAQILKTQMPGRS